jgi:CubicO group peptidase (beta-lactamase class C family)
MSNFSTASSSNFNNAVIGNLKVDGVATVATATAGTNTTQAASTAFVNASLNPKLSTEFKTALTAVADNAVWKPSYGPIVNGNLPYGNNVFVPLAGVCVWRNGDEFKYTAGIADGSGIPASNDTIYPLASMTKVVTVLLYERLKTLGIVPQGNIIKMKELFTDMSGIVFSVPYISARVATVMKDEFGVPVTMKDSSGVPIVDSNGSLVFMTEFAEPSDVLKDTSGVAIRDGNGSWICSKDTTRELYLDDIFSESIGFAATGGFDEYSINPYPYFYANTKYYGNNTGAGYTGTNTLLDPIENINNYFNVFKTTGKKCLMLHDHGILNYGSSANFGTGAILQLYKNDYIKKNNGSPFNGSYFDILKKELLEPCGAGNMFYFVDNASDSRRALRSDTWKVDQTNLRYRNIKASLTRYLDGNGSTPGIPKNYNGGTGLNGTLSDFVKVATLAATGGITQSGVRLINANNISGISVPRVTSNEWSNYTIAGWLKTFAVSFSLGGVLFGPSSYLNVSEPTWQFVGETQGTIAGVADTLWNNSFDAYGWVGANGTWFGVVPSTKTVIAFSTMESQSTFQTISLKRPLMDLLNNEFSQVDNLVARGAY